MTFCQGWVNCCIDKAERDQIIQSMIDQQLITEMIVPSSERGRPVTIYTITDKGIQSFRDEYNRRAALRDGAQ